MARVTTVPNSKLSSVALSPLRLVLVLVFLLCLFSGLVYIFILPLRQIYWGVSDRLHFGGFQRSKAGLASVADPAPVLEPHRTGPKQEGAIPKNSDPPVQSVQSNKDGLRLSRELVARVAKQDTVAVTWANWHYRDFVDSWVLSLKKTGCTAYLVGAMDDKLMQYLVSKQVPTFNMSSGLTLDDFGWGTPTFHKMGRSKIGLIAAFTALGFNVLISDVDTVWLRDPLPYMWGYADADILTSSDHLRNTVSDEGLEKWPDAASAANIGIMYFRPKAAELAAEWQAVLDADESLWDQNVFNDLFRRGSQAVSGRSDRLFECYDGKLKCGILPVALFCSGHTGFVQRMPESLGLEPYVVHATFQFSGTPGKRHRMRERLWWNDAPEYFSHPKGFLSFEDALPADLLEAAKTVDRNFTLEATLPHFNLVNHQLKRLRTAFAIAQITGRAVILPKFFCGMDRWWAPHDGTIPGSALTLPFLCPADHVLDLEAMSRALPEDAHGSNIDFREYSFLENPNAASLKASTLTLEVCKGTTDAECTDKPLKAKADERQLQASLTDGPAGQAKVLHIVGIEHAFGGWSEALAKERFKRRLDLYGAIWCCVNAHPGHIWYDFFFDEIPHRDRHNRPVEQAWKPVTGP